MKAAKFKQGDLVTITGPSQTGEYHPKPGTIGEVVLVGRRHGDPRGQWYNIRVAGYHTDKHDSNTFYEHQLEGTKAPKPSRCFKAGDRVSVQSSHYPYHFGAQYRARVKGTVSGVWPDGRGFDFDLDNGDGTQWSILFKWKGIMRLKRKAAKKIAGYHYVCQNSADRKVWHDDGPPCLEGQYLKIQCKNDGRPHYRVIRKPWYK